MFHIFLFLLSLFSFVQSMDLVKPEKDYVLLRDLVRLEGYNKAKRRGDKVVLHQNAANMASSLDEQYKAGNFPGDIYNIINRLAKRNYYQKKPIYQFHPNIFGRQVGTGVESLCVDEKNNNVCALTLGGNVCIFDINTKKLVAYIPDQENISALKFMNIDDDGSLFVHGKNFVVAEAQTGNIIKVYENAPRSLSRNVSEFELKHDRSGLNFKLYGDRVQITDDEGNKLQSLAFENVLWKPRYIAIDQRDGILYLGSNNHWVNSAGPVINYKEAMNPETGLLPFCAVTHGEPVESFNDVKRSSDGCTIL